MFSFHLDAVLRYDRTVPHESQELNIFKKVAHWNNSFKLGVSIEKIDSSFFFWGGGIVNGVHSSKITGKKQRVAWNTLESLERVTKREVLCLEERWKQALVSSVRNSHPWDNNKQLKCSKHFLKSLYEI